MDGWTDADYLVDEINRVRKVGYVYALYGEGRRLLYIGQTVNLRTRMAAHKSERRVWPLVRHIRVLEVPLADMGRMERELIHAHHPPMNRSCLSGCYTDQRQAIQRAYRSALAARRNRLSLRVITLCAVRRGLSRPRSFRPMLIPVPCL